jgi:hypothetical protein
MLEIVASKKRNQRMDNSSDDEEEEVDELNSSDNDSEADSDVENSTRKSKKKSASKKRKGVAANIVLETSSQLLEQVDESAPNTQTSLYGKKKSFCCEAIEYINVTF